MDGRFKRMRIGLALIVLVTFVAMPSMADEKVSLFNPFSLQSKTVVVSDSTPSTLLSDFLLLAAGDSANGRLGNADPRPTISLRGQEIRIPQRPNLRSSYSRVPYAASVW
jgi:hypothetical protein